MEGVKIWKIKTTDFVFSSEKLFSNSIENNDHYKQDN